MAERIPRASISARFLDDEDVISLLDAGDDGARAVLMYVQLLIMAKQLANSGRFKGKIERYAARLSIAPARARRLLSMIEEVCKNNQNSAWIVASATGFEIRAWLKWNENPGWGGKRDGAGRSPNNQDDSSLNQDEIKMKSRWIQDGNTSDTDTDTSSARSAQPLDNSLSPKRGDAREKSSRASEHGLETPRECLTRLGVTGVALGVLVRAGGITTTAIREEALDITDADNPSGVLVSRLCKRYGVEIPKGRKAALGKELSGIVGGIEQARRNHRPAPKENT